MSLQTVLTALADAIRIKSGRSDSMTLEQMTEAVNGIQQEGIDTNLPEGEAATEEDMVKGKSAYVNGEKVVGSVPITYPGNATIYKGNAIDSESDKKVSVYNRIDSDILVRKGTVLHMMASYMDFGNADAKNVLPGNTFTSAAGFRVPGTMPMQEAKTITPGTADQVIAAGVYLGGDQTVKGDANLLAQNIKSGVSIFGVAGTLAESSGGIDTTLPGEEAATEEDIVKGKSAWVNGEKVTGSIPFHNAMLGVNIVPKLSSNGDAVALLHIINKKEGYFAGSEVSLLSPLANFGDAGVGDVSAGKTFTSYSGLKAVGTRTEPVIRLANNVLSIT